MAATTKPTKLLNWPVEWLSVAKTKQGRRKQSKRGLALAAMGFHGVVGFVGLDDLSLDLASSLIRSGYKVQAFEVSFLVSFSLLNLWFELCFSVLLDLDLLGMGKVIWDSYSRHSCFLSWYLLSVAYFSTLLYNAIVSLADVWAFDKWVSKTRGD